MNTDRKSKAASWLDRIVVSPCSNPGMTWDEALNAYATLGYKNFEVFTSWAHSAVDLERPPRSYRESARKYGMALTSMHLPPVTEAFQASLDLAITAAGFAQSIGAEVVLYKAATRELYIRGARPFLDAIEGLSITPVLQNHAGTALSTPDDFREVIAGINDSRMKTLLEVGQFHTVGVSWRQGWDLLGDSIVLVHIKDQIGAQSVPFGTGEIDLPGLLDHLRSAGYTGRYVVEMEVEDRENTLRYLGEALEYMKGYRALLK